MTYHLVCIPYTKKWYRCEILNISAHMYTLIIVYTCTL